MSNNRLHPVLQRYKSLHASMKGLIIIQDVVISTGLCVHWRDEITHLETIYLMITGFFFSSFFCLNSAEHIFSKDLALLFVSFSGTFHQSFSSLLSPFLQTLPTTTYELEIVAKDMAGSEVGLRGTATATITITDNNDHAPEFTHPLVRGKKIKLPF